MNEDPNAAEKATRVDFIMHVNMTEEKALGKYAVVNIYEKR